MEMKAAMAVFVFLSLFNPNTSVFRKHFYVENSMKWSDAQSYCRKHHHDLSTVSLSDLTRLSANPRIKTNFYWIGLYRDAQKPTMWRWSSGSEEATNVMWAVGQPDTLHEQCAVILKSSNKAFDTPCLSPIPFYCMEDFELVLVQQGNTWDEAVEHCRLNYLDLAGLTSEATMTEAQNKSATALTDDVWVGLRFITGHWFWLNGNNGGYKAWSSDGELQCPALNRRCGVYDRKLTVWKPANCVQRLNFLCIRKLFS